VDLDGSYLTATTCSHPKNRPVSKDLWNVRFAPMLLWSRMSKIKNFVAKRQNVKRFPVACAKLLLIFHSHAKVRFLITKRCSGHGSKTERRMLTENRLWLDVIEYRVQEGAGKK
jgi:hypothetical protein